MTLTPNHHHLRYQECQVRAHLRSELIFVVFSDDSRFCLGERVCRILVRRRLGERLDQSSLWHRRNEPTPEVMIWGAISYDSRDIFFVIRRILTNISTSDW
ncbi:hypothetical protein AVEN_64379-1 [Araneus ventricosus]|uniref:Tc1-like transposase DDE domain-containing protein n=1 Tax=Araneus ventricosus TaxID=182803 RepID=A0A4Y2DAQ7_ARAVE|nr:hypothetical protein AVEN_64379-1 [Araneus ventricosus]